MKLRPLALIFLCSPATIARLPLHGQQNTLPAAEVHLHLSTSQGGKHHVVPAVVWLDPVAGTPATPFVSEKHYTLLQKNRTFMPHLQVVPVGGAVEFPNADPFFHNVFSLFDGRRFDLGLYEAGSSKSVTFTREGVSYIFCNIHPEMSAVVISIPTRLYELANESGAVRIHNIPPGDYRMQVWAEGVPQSLLEQWKKNVHLHAGVNDLGDIQVPVPSEKPTHTNKFGHAYEQTPQNTY